jgi:hypothetical protein
MLGGRRGEKYKSDMNERLIEVGVFFLGAGSGALLKYLQDRRLLHYYGELVGQLSRALQQHVDGITEARPAERAKLMVVAERSRAGSTM